MPASVLEGIRVLTLEQVHALPWGTAFLADLGAQVIRIESVEHLQDRKAGPFVERQARAGVVERGREPRLFRHAQQAKPLSAR